MNSALPRFESPLRLRHEEFVRTECGRRSAQVAMRGEGVELPTQGQIEWIPWGDTTKTVASYGSVELEYAAIRRGAALCDLPQRGVIEVRGAQRLEFLQRMLTQDLKAVTAGGVRPSFCLNRKGRIEADLLVCELGDRLLLECAASVAHGTSTALAGFIFSEDVSIADMTGTTYRLALHGPQAVALLEQAGAIGSSLSPLSDNLTCAWVEVGALRFVVARRDLCGEVGLELFVARDEVDRLWGALLCVSDLLKGGVRRARPCGWHALNIARIEGGSPLFEIDFSTQSLPHETGVISSRVSFTKGCYPGQEVVARMQSLGKPKQVVRALRMDGEHLPAGGAQIHLLQPSGDIGDALGVVTSSTVSPMCSGACIGFATVRTAQWTDGMRVAIDASGDGGGMESATLREGLADFAPRPGDAGGAG